MGHPVWIELIFSRFSIVWHKVKVWDTQCGSILPNLVWLKATIMEHPVRFELIFGLLSLVWHEAKVWCTQ